MKKEKCPWSKKCQNGGDGCWCRELEKCVRFLPVEGTNLTEIKGVVETPPGVDYDQFSQHFSNWIEAMGWSFCGSFGKYEEKDEKEDDAG